MRNKYIDQHAVQCELAILCLRYLCLPCFSPKYDEEERRDKAKFGWFSFQDYACSQWHSHIHTIITECKNLFLVKDRSQAYEEQFTTALEYFISTHSGDLTTVIHPDLKQLPSELEWCVGFSFFSNLRLLWNHIYTHQKSTDENVRNTVGIAAIDEALQMNRITIEKSFKPNNKAASKDNMEDYYGPNIFKCSRTMCKFFYQGYSKRKDRDMHYNRHERPYKCPLNCGSAPLGFSTIQNKENHVRVYHPELSEGAELFNKGAGRPPPRISCEFCGTSFTTKNNLKAHLRSHFDCRPYACQFCLKAFQRVSDMSRHEKIHRRYAFESSTYDLQAGSDPGCANGITDKQNRVNEQQTVPTEVGQRLAELTPRLTETATIYSDTSSLATSRQDDYISELANDLFSNVKNFHLNIDLKERLSSILPDLLKDFALKLGHEAPTATHLEVMAIVHKHRQ